MLALGLVLNTLGIGLFCWAIFALAVYALPFFVALSVGMLAFDGAGVVGALLIGLASGALTLAVGQVAVTVSRVRTLRVAIATAFAVPAAIAGYHVVFALSQIGVPSLAWREAFACGGAVCIGGTAWTLDRFRGDAPVGVGRGGGACASTSSHSRHARVMRHRRHHRSKVAQGATLNEGVVELE
ncbi:MULTISPECIES: hypothetical protein [Bradyrhizobium]|uniref:hypothetical protein n=1 Tax=Bradyrhizobium centrosematis TaxID=1300039 RepID=UPI00216833D2|nr:hypothetical protein [Bradyrhizobium centrosematis]MCS3765576.1 hypothetical protein [Bradyrhizobium centrosematis]MCS3778110.1 hypothetical protein [Bradyrhizobium centrosematis]